LLHLQKKASLQRFVSDSWVDHSLFPAKDVGSKLLSLPGGFEDETTAVVMNKTEVGYSVDATGSPQPVCMTQSPWPQHLDNLDSQQHLRENVFKMLPMQDTHCGLLHWLSVSK
jgi:hypothetical protein